MYARGLEMYCKFKNNKYFNNHYIFILHTCKFTVCLIVGISKFPVR